MLGDLVIEMVFQLRLMDCYGCLVARSTVVPGSWPRWVLHQLGGDGVVMGGLECGIQLGLMAAVKSCRRPVRVSFHKGWKALGVAVRPW